MCVLPGDYQMVIPFGRRKKNDFDYRGKRDCGQDGAGGSSARRGESSGNVPFQRGGGEGSGGDKGCYRGFFEKSQPSAGDARRGKCLSGVFSNSGAGATGRKRDRGERRGRCAANRAE